MKIVNLVFQIQYDIHRRLTNYLYLTVHFHIFLFWRIFYLGSLNIYLSSYRGIKRNVINELKKFDGPYVYLDGVILNVTSNIGSINIKHNKRLKGNSGYSFKKLFSLWLKVFTNSSIFPLRMASVTGFIVTIISLFFAVLLIIFKIRNPEIPQGWTSVATFIFFFSGVQLLALGIIGEYIGRIFINLNQKPQYIIKEQIRNVSNE